MIFGEMQAEWARSLLQLAETNLRTFNTVFTAVVEVTQPKPVSPFGALFGAANPWLSANLNVFGPSVFTPNVFTPNAFSPWLGMMPGGQGAGLFGGQANPWVQSWMASLWTNTPWGSLLGRPSFVPNLFGPNLSSEAFAAGANFWNANPWPQAWQWARPHDAMGANPVFSGNPWGSLWHPAGMGNLWSPMTILAGVGSHAGSAWLAPLQPRPAPAQSLPIWNWPFGGSNALH